MHIVLTFLGAIVTILILLYRLADAGISLGGLNPFLWRRRRAWRQRYEADPIFGIEDPMDLVALLALHTAKADGDLTGAERGALLHEFRSTFALGEQKGEELLAATAYLLGDGETLNVRLDEVVARSLDKFSNSQVESTLEILDRIASADGEPTAGQARFVERVAQLLQSQDPSGSTWA